MVEAGQVQGGFLGFHRNAIFIIMDPTRISDSRLCPVMVISSVKAIHCNPPAHYAEEVATT